MQTIPFITVGRCSIAWLLSAALAIFANIPAATAQAGGVAAAERAYPDSYVLIPDRLFDGSAMREGYGVAVNDGKIAAVGPAETLTAARRFRLPGATLLPGFIELHAHIVFQEVPADTVLRHGVTTARDLGGPVQPPRGGRGSLRQLAAGECKVENQYKRVVPQEGNLRALEALAEVFVLRPHFEWRGLGFISQSALAISDAYADLDAERRFTVPGVRVADPKACQCGEVLKGVIKPWECKVFGTACTPETPIGTCMVSPEGACAAYYNFGRLHRETAQLLGQRG